MKSIRCIAIAGLLLFAGCTTTPDEEPEKPASKVDQMTELREKIAANPDDPKLHYEYGNLLFDMGNYADASQAYQATIERDPKHFKAYMNLGITLGILDNTAAALGAFETALDIKPDDPEALQRLLTAAQELGDTERMLTAGGKLAEMNPDNPDVVAGYAALLMQNRMHAEAAVIYERVIALEGSVAGDYYNLGLCQYNLLQFDQAEASWRKALEIAPDLPEANRGLAVLYWDQGYNERAWEQVQKCVEMGIPVEPDFIKALEADSRARASEADSAGAP